MYCKNRFTDHGMRGELLLLFHMVLCIVFTDKHIWTRSGNYYRKRKLRVDFATIVSHQLYRGSLDLHCVSEGHNRFSPTQGRAPVIPFSRGAVFQCHEFHAVSKRFSSLSCPTSRVANHRNKVINNRQQVFACSIFVPFF